MNSSTDIIQWPPRPELLPLAGKAIHVWAAPLNGVPESLEKFTATLSPEEKERAQRFKLDKLRNRFIAGRGTLREILGHYLQIKPLDLRFAYSANGKPMLAEKLADSGIHFNLAHSGDLAVVAITRVGEIGVDVEQIRPIKNVEDLVARFFSSRENEQFQKIPADEKPAAFFNLWTRKEALLKATGEGITGSLKLVEVSFLPGTPARLLAISGDAPKAGRWRLQELLPAIGFTGAVAIEARDVVVKCARW